MLAVYHLAHATEKKRQNPRAALFAHQSLCRRGLVVKRGEEGVRGGILDAVRREIEQGDAGSFGAGSDLERGFDDHAQRPQRADVQFG